MRIEAKTRITYPVYRTFFLFNFMQGKRSPWQARLTLILPPLMFTLFLILYLIDPADPVNLAAALVMLGLGITLGLILLLVPRRYFRSVEKLLSQPSSFVFDEQHFEVHSESPLLQGHTEGQYALIHKAYETADFFYVYITASQAHLIGKADLTAGSPAELRRLLQEQLGGRFVLTPQARKADRRQQPQP